MRNVDAGDIERTYIDFSVTSVDASKYTMKGGLVTPPARGRNVFSRNSAEQVTPKTPAPKALARGDKTPAPTPGGKTTWGEWLKSLIPESVKKVAVNRPAELAEEMDMETSLVLVPSPSPSSPSGPSEVEEPEKKGFSVPGGFDEKPLVEEEKPIEEEKSVVRKRTGYINPLLAMEVYTHPPPSKSPYWSFDDSIYTSGKYRARPPVRIERQSASFTGYGRSAGVMPRGRAVLPPPIQPSSVPSQGGYKRVRTALRQPGLTEEEKNRIAEERLVELEMIERDRRVEMQEDAYEKRLLLAQLRRSSSSDDDNMDAEGSQTDDDSAMENADQPTKDKGKAKETATAEEAPKSPETARPVSKPSSFLFGGSTYDPSCAPPRPVLSKPVEPPRAPPAPEAKDNASSAPPPPVLSKPEEPRRAPPAPEAKEKKTVSFSGDSDKENLTKSPSPPATPTLSHAQLPNPIAPTGPALLPPPTQSPQLSPQKGGSGLGFGDPALKARSQAEKFKPHVSSGLRSSTTMRSDSPPRTRATNGTTSPVKRTGTSPAAPQFLSPIPEKKQQQQRSPSPKASLDGRISEVKQAGMVSILSMQVDEVISHENGDDSQKGMESGVNDGDLRTGLQLKTTDQSMLDMFTAALAPQPAKGGIFGDGDVKKAVENVWVMPKEEEVNGIMGMIMEGMKAAFFGPI